MKYVSLCLIGLLVCWGISNLAAAETNFADFVFVQKHSLRGGISGSSSRPNARPATQTRSVNASRQTSFAQRAQAAQARANARAATVSLNQARQIQQVQQRAMNRSLTTSNQNVPVRAFNNSTLASRSVAPRNGGATPRGPTVDPGMPRSGSGGAPAVSPRERPNPQMPKVRITQPSKPSQPAISNRSGNTRNGGGSIQKPKPQMPTVRPGNNANSGRGTTRPPVNNLNPGSKKPGASTSIPTIRHRPNPSMSRHRPGGHGVKPPPPLHPCRPPVFWSGFCFGWGMGSLWYDNYYDYYDCPESYPYRSVFRYGGYYAPSSYTYMNSSCNTVIYSTTGNSSLLYETATLGGTTYPTEVTPVVSPPVAPPVITTAPQEIPAIPANAVSSESSTESTEIRTQNPIPDSFKMQCRAVKKLSDGLLVRVWQYSESDPFLYHIAVGEKSRGFREVILVPLSDPSKMCTYPQLTMYEGDSGVIMLHAEAEGVVFQPLKIERAWIEAVSVNPKLPEDFPLWSHHQPSLTNLGQFFPMAALSYFPNTKNPAIFTQFVDSAELRNDTVDFRAGGAIFNFPSTMSGVVSFVLYIPSGSGGCHISLCDRPFNGSDAIVPQQSVYTLFLKPNHVIDGKLLAADKMYRIEMIWDAGVCDVFANGVKIAELNAQHDSEIGVNYIQWVSGATQVDAGFYFGEFMMNKNQK